MHRKTTDDWRQSSRYLIRKIESGLGRNQDIQSRQWDAPARLKGSAVLFLLTMHAVSAGTGTEPCLLLNKRSKQVLQPGDLCCPGGGLEPKDRTLAKLVRWPISPLGQWLKRNANGRRHPAYVDALAVLLAAALRESWEEMRLNPLNVRFLGPLGQQRLIMFDRVIYPMAGWTPHARKLRPNWEVDRIVHIPLRRLLDPQHYGRYALDMSANGQTVRHDQIFPCFIHNGSHGRELLWGATFRITMDFLGRVFGFQLPDLTGAPLTHGRLGQTYLSGSLMEDGRTANSIKMSRDDY